MWPNLDPNLAKPKTPPPPHVFRDRREALIPYVKRLMLDHGYETRTVEAVLRIMRDAAETGPS